MASDERAAPHRGRVVSAACFRVLSLQLETQNEVDVLKPILEELEVLRLACVLGALPSVNPKDFEFELLEAREFDDDFARFLRHDVFDGHGADPSVRVVGLFGKQPQVKFQLQALHAWDDGMDQCLQPQDLGLYAVVVELEDGVKTAIVFPWLVDEYFHADRLRETPAYLLRLLTCLTSDVTCCLSQQDKTTFEEFSQRDDDGGNGSDEEWRSYSAAFHVEQQLDAKDDVWTIEDQVDVLPNSIRFADKLDVVKGSFPAVVTISKSPPSKRLKLPGRKSFNSPIEFAKWLLRGTDRFDLRVSSIFWSKEMIEAILRECDEWPQEKIDEAHEKLRVQRIDAELEVREKVASSVGKLRDKLEAIGHLVFDLDALCDEGRIAESIDFLKQCVQDLRSDDFMPTNHTVVVLHLPARLPRMIPRFQELFENGFTAEFEDALQLAPTTKAKYLPTVSLRRSFFGKVSSLLFGDSNDLSERFRDRMQVPLESMKQVWWAEVTSVYDKIQALAALKKTEIKMKQLDQKWEEDRDALISNAFEQLLDSWSRSELHGLQAYINVQQYRLGQPILCSIEEEELLPSRDQIHVWSFKPPNSVSSGRSLIYLGCADLHKGETLLQVFTVQTRSILVISTAHDRTFVRRVEFGLEVRGKRNLPQEYHIREVTRLSTLCDYYEKERLLVLADVSGKAGVYRLDDKFKAMETIRTLNLALTSLVMPVKDMVLSDGILYMVDHEGSMQSLNTRNQQTSRKVPIGFPRGTEDKARLVRVMDGNVLGWIEINGDSAASVLKFIAAEDMRELPQSMPAMLPPQINGPKYQVLDDSLIIVDQEGGAIYAFKLEASLKSESYRIRSVNGARSGDSEGDSGGISRVKMLSLHWLWTFYHLYEKFPVRAELFRNVTGMARQTLTLSFACDAEKGDESSDLNDGCQKLLGLVLEKLEQINKPLYGLDLGTRNVEVYCGPRSRDLASEVYASVSLQPVATLLRELVTFVPMQICRAEFNSLTLMMDGQSKPQDDVSEDKSVSSTDIAMKLRFGLLSPLLASWGRQCVVITSMGKQSTGKSYFLNHLTGTSFAISGARCTDGAWMSVRFLPNGVMLVVIDFEGLGSFERTEQEDVFLSVLNASVSMLTIFRMEMRLDKEIDDLFSKFQKGSQLIKNDPQLFRGKLYMSVKDVNPNDQKGVVGEFVTKFQRLLESNREQNFLTDMYAGQLEINCSPPLGTLGYYRSLSHVQRHIEKQLCGNSKAGFPSGKAFLDCVRLLLAKVSILDWTSLDESTLRMKIAESLKTLSSILRFGGVVNGYDETKGKSTAKLVQPDKLIIAASGEYITADLDELCTANPSLAAKWRQLAVSTLLNDVDDDVIDLGPSMELLASERSAAVSSAIRVLFMTFVDLCNASRGEQIVTKNQQHDFDVFLSFVIRRRCMRVQKWSRSVFGDRLPEAWNATEQQALSQLQTLFVRCLDSCSECQLGCMKASTHTTDGDHAHDCATSHKCLGPCSYCSDPDDDDIKPQCSKPAGHDGRCECDKGDHTCGKPCVLEGASNCGRLCSKKAGHEDTEDHRCSVGLHKCGQPCLAPSCTRRCVMDFEVPHTAHKCEVDRCLSRCIMEGCNRSCSSTDHFHSHTDVKVAFDVENPDLAAKAGGMFDASSEKPTIHMCEEAHACPEMCGQDGICHIDVMLKQSSKTFVGARGSFQYTFQEMNGSRKKCARKLAPGQMVHSGHHTCVHSSHLHDGDEETKSSEFENQVIHYCDVRCPCCSYYCMKEHGHSGLHKTTHGNMRNTFFLSDEASIDLIDRKYTAGERGTAEMCNLYCSKMGRGHVHFLDCEKENANDECVYQGSREDMRRHCKLELEPKPDKEQDEVLHERFWDTLGWEDPCASIQEREEFAKCSYHCDAPDHEDKGVSYCVLPAWHELCHPNGADDGFTYVSGHKFQCSHVTVSDKIHHVFVLDASGSMRGSAWTRLNEAFRAYLQNRVDDGSTLDLVSVITFDGTAHIAWEAEPITAMTNAEAPFRGGGTSFSAALRAANEVISRMNFETYKPVVVFFSDGHPAEGHEGDALAKHIAETYVRYGLQSFAVGFGHVNLGMLEWLAELLGGSYCQVLTGDELKTTFHSISASLGTRAGLALTKPLHEMICVICQKELASEASAVLSPCHHELHQRCLRSLLESSAAGEARLCPTCRQPINVTA